MELTVEEKQLTPLSQFFFSLESKWAIEMLFQI